MCNKLLHSAALSVALAALTFVSVGTAAPATDTDATFDANVKVAALASHAGECFKIKPEFQIERRQCEASVRQEVAELSEAQAKAVSLAIERGPTEYNQINVRLRFKDATAVAPSDFIFVYVTHDSWGTQPAFAAPLK
jgi:hypothetical protein